MKEYRIYEIKSDSKEINRLDLFVSTEAEAIERAKGLMKKRSH